MTAARDRLEADGAVLVPGIVDKARCAGVHAAIERSRAEPSAHYARLSPPGEAPVDSDLFRWFDDPGIRAVVFDSRLPALAGELLGSAAVVFVEDQWLASAPGAGTPSPWHQDEPYYNIDGAFVTLWLALDDAPAGAALQVVPGSHRWGRTFAPAEFAATGATIGGTGGLEPVPAGATAAASTMGWDVSAGDVIALHPLTLHRAGASRGTGGWFRRLSTRWAAPDARYVDRGEQAATFWRMLPHGLSSGDRLACATFPLVPA